MRALFFLPDLDGGGAQRTMVNLVNKIGAHGVEPVLLVARADGPAETWLADHVRLIDLKASRTLRSLPGLRRQLATIKPDVLIATMVDANIMATVASAGKRMRLILRETNSHRARGDIHGLRRSLIKWAYRRADAVVALSSGVRRELIADYGLDPQKVCTIGNPVDVETITATAAASRAEPPPFQSSDGPVVIAVGRLTHQKGFDILLDALTHCRTEPRLILLGEGANRADLDAQIKRLGLAGRVTMPGFVQNPIAWLAHANLLVLPSRWEGFGHVIVEAMAAGIPVLATDCPHGPADIIRNGVNGILVEPHESAALSAAIDDLLSDNEKRSRLATVAQQDARRYSVDNIVSQYVRLMKQTDQGFQD